MCQDHLRTNRTFTKTSSVRPKVFLSAKEVCSKKKAWPQNFHIGRLQWSLNNDHDLANAVIFLEMALQNLIKLMPKNLPASFVMISQLLKPVMKEQSLEI